MIYQHTPVDPQTASHALTYLSMARRFAERHNTGPIVALNRTTARVPRPCRAIGVARQALVEGRSFDGAVALLEGV